MTLEHTESSELSEGIQLDMTTTASAEYGGVSGSLESHLGITVNATQATSSSTTTTTSFSDKVDRARRRRIRRRLQEEYGAVPPALRPGRQRGPGLHLVFPRA